MKRDISSGLNKEKLVFVGTIALLAASLYNCLASRPVQLTAGTPVTSLSAPPPLKPERIDLRQTRVLAYLTGERNNPFWPPDSARTPPRPWPPFPPTPTVPGAKAGDLKRDSIKIEVGPPPEVATNPSPQNPPISVENAARIDFSAVMSMGDRTVALLKSNGRTLKVRTGDYLEDQKLKVARIDPLAIYVTDSNDRVRVARDTTFDGAASASADAAPKSTSEKTRAPGNVKR